MRKLYASLSIFAVILLTLPAWSQYVPQWIKYNFDELIGLEPAVSAAAEEATVNFQADCGLSGTISSTPVTKCDNNGNGAGALTVGSLTLAGSSVNMAHYTYTWYYSNDIYGSIVGTGQTFETFDPDNYTVIIEKKNDSSCRAILTGQIEDKIPETVIDIIKKPAVPECDKFTTVTVEVKDVGGNNFQVEWWKDGKKYYNNKTTVVLDQPGTWTMIGFNPETKCTFTDIIVLDGMVRTPEVAATFKANTNCENSNGEVVFTVTTPEGGTEPPTGYGYTLKDADGNSYPIDLTTLTAGNLPAGSYTLTISNDHYTSSGELLGSCPKEFTFVVDDATAYPEAVLTATDNTICSEGSGLLFNGTVTAAVTLNGSPVTDFSGYTIEWRKGGTSYADAAPLTATGAALSNLSGDTYWFSIKSPDGCTIQAPVAATVNDALPTHTLAVLSNTPQTNCLPTGNGAFQVQLQDAAGNAVSGATYAVFNGTSAGGSSVSSVSGGVASSLSSGDYFVVATDPATNCVSELPVTIALSQVIPTFTTATEPNIGCTTGFTGKIEVTPALGAISDYSYTFSNGGGVVQTGTSNILNNQPDGDYSVSIKNTLGCESLPVAVSILQDISGLTLNLVATAQKSCSVPDGSITANMTGATDTVSYKVYEGTSSSGTLKASSSSTNIFTGLGNINAATDYYVEATDAATGCMRYQTVTVPLQQEKPVLSYTVTNNTGCIASKYSGKIETTLSYSDPTAAFTYTWYDASGVITGQTGPDLLNRGAGNYQVQAKHTGTGCTSDLLDVTIYEDLPVLTLDLTPTAQTNCPDASGTPNGAITASLASASSTVTYAWYEGEDTSSPLSGAGSGPTVTGLAGGKTYTIVATDDATGCSQTNSVVVPLLQEQPILNLSGTDNSGCTTGFDGTITATATHSTVTAFTYNLYSAGSTTASQSNATGSFSGLQDGNYTVVAVADGLACSSDPVDFTIKLVKKPYAITYTLTDQTNCPDGTILPNGSIQPILEDGLGNPYPAASVSYTWSTGGSSLASANVSGGDAINLTGDKTYTVTATDAATGCTISQDIYVPLTQPSYLLTAVATNNTICDPANPDGVGYNGKIVASIINGTIDENEAEYTFSWVKPDGTSVTGTNELTGLGAGTYTVEAYNTAGGCLADQISVEVKDNLTYPGLELTTTPNEYCAGTGNGTATVTLTGALAIDLSLYKITWTDEDGVNIGSGTSISSLSKGTYTATVLKNDNGCSASISKYVDEDLKQLEATISTSVDFGCDPTSTAELTASVTAGGTLVTDYTGYTFVWTRYQVDGTATPTVTTSGASGNVYPNLAYSGKYAVSITSPFGCTTEATHTLSPKPAGFTVIQTINNKPSFCADANGQLTASIVMDDGSPAPAGFTYAWYQGKPLNEPADFYSDPQIAFNTPSLGSTATLSGLTMGVYTVVATSPDLCKSYAYLSLPFVDAHKTVTSISHIDECPATASGEVIIQVQDKNDVTIPDTDMGDYDIYLFAGNNPDVTDLSAAIRSSTGNTANNIQFTGLAAGEYVVIAKETNTASKCASAPENITIEKQAVAPALTVGTVTDNTVCSGTENGAVSITFGPGDYKTGFTDPFTDAFQLTLEDANGNKDVRSGLLAGTESFTNLAPGTYTISITGDPATTSNSCSTTKTFTVADKPQLPEITAAVTADLDNCSPGAAGVISVTSLTLNGNPIAVANYGDYTFEWVLASDGSSVSDSQPDAGDYLLTTDNPANYKVRVTRNPDGTAGSGCSSPWVEVNLPDKRYSPDPTVTIKDNTSCDVTSNPNGEITVTAVTTNSIAGTLSNYSYYWDGSSTAGTTTFVAAPGSHTLRVYDELNDCEVTKTYTIGNKPVYPAVTKLATTNQTGCGDKLQGSLEVTVVTFNDSTYTDGPTLNLDGYFDFAWSDAAGSTGKKLTASAGTYTVTAVPKVAIFSGLGQSCASMPFSGVIQQQSTNPTVSLVSKSPNTICVGTPNGAISVTVSAGASTKWYQGASVTTGTHLPALDGKTSIASLAAGYYTVEAVDNTTSCTYSLPVQVVDQLNKPTVTLKIDNKLEICGTPAKLSIASVSIGNMATNYTFAWYKADGTPVAGTTSISTNDPGDYYVIATYKPTNCQAPKATITLPDNRAYPNLTKTVTDNTACSGTGNGSISIAFSPGTTGHSVTIVGWKDDLTNTSNSRKNLDPGVYTVTLSEQGCEKEYNITVGDNTNFYPAILNIDATKQTECTPNGSLTVTKVEINGDVFDAKDATSPANLDDYFDFIWYLEDGVTKVQDDPSMTTAVISGAAINGIPSGIYKVAAIRKQGPGETDVPVGAGCPSLSVSATVGREGDFPIITFVATDNNNCSGPGNGSIDASISGGVAPYSYSWNTGATSEDLSTLVAGTYTLTVTDKAGCTTTSTVDLKTTPYTAQVLRLQVTDNTSCGTSNSELKVTKLSFMGTEYTDATYLDANYTFNWYTSETSTTLYKSGRILSGEPAGEYWVEARRKNDPGKDCPSVRFYGNIKDVPSYPSVTLQASPNQNCVNPNGKITPIITGNPADFTFAWSGPGSPSPAADGSISNLAAGTYTLILINNLGCTKEVSFNLPEELSYPVATETIDHISTCSPPGGGAPSGDGKISLDLSLNGVDVNEATEYDFSWTGPAGAPALPNAPVITSRVTGTYSVTITPKATSSLAGKGCSITYSYILSDETPALDVFLYDWRMINGCNTDGMLEIRADGYSDATDADYTFQWFDAAGNPLAAGANRIEGLTLGTYRYTVHRISSNCTVSGEFSVDNSTVIPFLTASAEGQWLCSPEDGRLAARVENYKDLKRAIGPVSFEFQWYRGEHTTNPGTSHADFVASLFSFADPNVDVASVLLNDQPNGQYTVFAIQVGGNGCTTLPDLAAVLDFRSYPEPQIVVAKPLQNCDPTKPDAILSGSVGGETEGYDFEWYEGTDLTADPIATGDELSGAQAIRYTLLARDQYTQCTDTISLQVPADYYKVTLDPYWLGQEPSLSCLKPNGKLFITVDTLYDDYLFSWYRGPKVHADSLIATDVTLLENMEAGIYTVTAQNREHGCISDGTQVRIESEYYVPAVDLKITPATCTTPGRVEVIDLDGQVKDYYWSDGKNIFYSDSFTGDAGEYYVTITSLEGCRTTIPFVIDEVIKAYNAISANGDGQNDYFHITCIDLFPTNIVKIYNRAGVLVFEIEGYDNDINIFTGQGNRGVYLGEQNLPDGTYFYVIDRKNGTRPEHGFLELIR